MEQAILYGSRAKGNYKKGSDIDLTLRGSKDLTLNVLYKILDDLDELLLPYTIDLSILDNIDDLDVIEHIRRVGRSFYERGKAFHESEVMDKEIRLIEVVYAGTHEKAPD